MNKEQLVAFFEELLGALERDHAGDPAEMTCEELRNQIRMARNRLKGCPGGEEKARLARLAVRRTA